MSQPNNGLLGKKIAYKLIFIYLTQIYGKKNNILIQLAFLPCPVLSDSYYTSTV
jgi:hypothetical protein